MRLRGASYFQLVLQLSVVMGRYTPLLRSIQVADAQRALDFEYCDPQKLKVGEAGSFQEAVLVMKCRRELSEKYARVATREPATAVAMSMLGNQALPWPAG